MTRIVILGAGEHGRTVADACSVANYEVVGFFDDTKEPGEKINGVPVLGGFDLAINESLDEEAQHYVALGDSEQRLSIGQRLKENGRKLATVIDPRAVVKYGAEVGEGSFINALSLVAVNAQIEKQVIVNSFSSVGVDAHVQSGTLIAPACTISRGAFVGRRSFIGTGAIVLPDVRIGTNCIIGAGSLVTKDIPDNCTAYGSPCRVVKENA
jgi:sugar O-acyltransferase (sialic acid O-acetyltransferase NeuD family)